MIYQKVDLVRYNKNYSDYDFYFEFSAHHKNVKFEYTIHHDKDVFKNFRT